MCRKRVTEKIWCFVLLLSLTILLASIVFYILTYNTAMTYNNRNLSRVTSTVVETTKEGIKTDYVVEFELNELLYTTKFSTYFYHLGNKISLILSPSKEVIALGLVIDIVMNLSYSCKYLMQISSLMLLLSILVLMLVEKSRKRKEVKSYDSSRTRDAQCGDKEVSIKE